jgi:hypothetical protein
VKLTRSAAAFGAAVMLGAARTSGLAAAEVLGLA